MREWTETIPGMRWECSAPPFAIHIWYKKKDDLYDIDFLVVRKEHEGDDFNYCPLSFMEKGFRHSLEDAKADAEKGLLRWRRFFTELAISCAGQPMDKEAIFPSPSVIKFAARNGWV